MLVDFSVSNFRSYKSEAQFTMEAGNHLKKRNKENTVKINDSIRLLKDVGIFGANSAGKSSIIYSMGRMKALILGPTSSLNARLPFSPFKFDIDSKNKDTSFRIKFTKNRNIYEYYFTYNQKEFTNEYLKVAELTVRGHKPYRTLFEKQAGEIIKLPAEYQKIKTTDSIRRNVLILYVLQDVNYKYATEVLDWFQNDLIIFGPGIDLNLNIFNDDNIKNPVVKSELRTFFKAADINIEELVYRESKVEVPDFIKKIMDATGSKFRDENDLATNREIYTVHKSFDEDGRVINQEELSLSQESLGTQRIIMIALAIITAQLNSDNKTIIFDEFEEGLHEELAIALVELFNSETNKNQFIFTTHMLRLLDAGLRVDQIYLAEKKYSGESELYSVFDFPEASKRRDISFYKRYIQGQFGSVPIIDVSDFGQFLNKNNGDKNG